MQELVLVTTCDIDYSLGKRDVKGEEIIWFVGDEPWVVDLCKRHIENVGLIEMNNLVEEHGRPLSERRQLKQEAPAKKSRRSRKSSSDSLVKDGYTLIVTSEGRIVCPLCSNTYKNFSSMSGHFNIDHKIHFYVWTARQRGEEPQFFCVCGDGFMTARSRGIHITSMKSGVHRPNE